MLLRCESIKIKSQPELAKLSKLRHPASDLYCPMLLKIVPPKFSGKLLNNSHAICSWFFLFGNRVGILRWIKDSIKILFWRNWKKGENPDSSDVVSSSSPLSIADLGRQKDNF